MTRSRRIHLSQYRREVAARAMLRWAAEVPAAPAATDEGYRRAVRETATRTLVALGWLRRN